jgi:hypothetical protein
VNVSNYPNGLLIFAVIDVLKKLLKSKPKDTSKAGPSAHQETSMKPFE